MRVNHPALRRSFNLDIADCCAPHASGPRIERPQICASQQGGQDRNCGESGPACASYNDIDPVGRCTTITFFISAPRDYAAPSSMSGKLSRCSFAAALATVIVSRSCAHLYAMVNFHPRRRLFVPRRPAWSLAIRNRFRQNSARLPRRYAAHRATEPGQRLDRCCPVRPTVGDFSIRLNQFSNIFRPRPLLNDKGSTSPATASDPSGGVFARSALSSPAGASASVRHSK